ncbi:hypothetical protein EYF80_066811 [Liparis tanakae]|uniref:Uncharacterized protein n=1 Tax=Liparis tanakae TaxID=230148 RepID=A0A4Z2E3X5_9TELE|nr:hypothetical protein EYF80_066811 [Liparis tanakae]
MGTAVGSRGRAAGCHGNAAGVKLRESAGAGRQLLFLSEPRVPQAAVCVSPPPHAQPPESLEEEEEEEEEEPLQVTDVTNTQGSHESLVEETERLTAVWEEQLTEEQLTEEQLTEEQLTEEQLTEEKRWGAKDEQREPRRRGAWARAEHPEPLYKYHGGEEEEIGWRRVMERGRGGGGGGGGGEKEKGPLREGST